MHLYLERLERVGLGLCLSGLLFRGKELGGTGRLEDARCGAFRFWAGVFPFFWKGDA